MRFLSHHYCFPKNPDHVRYTWRAMRFQLEVEIVINLCKPTMTRIKVFRNLRNVRQKITYFSNQEFESRIFLHLRKNFSANLSASCEILQKICKSSARVRYKVYKSAHYSYNLCNFFSLRKLDKNSVYVCRFTC